MKILIPLSLLLVGCNYTKNITYQTIYIQDTIILDKHHYHFNSFDNTPVCKELPGDTVVFENQFTIQKKIDRNGYQNKR